MKVNVREGSGIIAVEDIKRILTDYRIGKKPLSKLLGWGETTIIRYIEGDVPTCEYSDKLKEILKNPSYYYEILLNNKENLTSVAYKKSRQAVLDKMMGSKISVVSQYIINQYNACICEAEIPYLLYYIQGFSLAFYNESIFSDEILVLMDEMLYGNFNKQVKVCLELREDLLSNQERELIQSVIDAFSWYSFKATAALARLEKSKQRISRDKENRKIISKGILKGFFREVLEKYEIKFPKDIRRYVNKRMVDIINIQ